jgi:hypothetical protein
MDVSGAYRGRIETYRDVSELLGYSEMPAGVSGAYHTRIAPTPISDTYPIRDTLVMGRIWVTQVKYYLDSNLRIVNRIVKIINYFFSILFNTTPMVI